MGWRFLKDVCSAWEAAFLELPAQRSIYISRPRPYRLIHIALRDCRNSPLTPMPYFISTSVMTTPILPGLSSRSMDRTIMKHFGHSLLTPPRKPKTLQKPLYLQIQRMVLKMAVRKRVRQFFPKSLRKCVDSMQSHRTVQAKWRAMPGKGQS